MAFLWLTGLVVPGQSVSLHRRSPLWASPRLPSPFCVQTVIVQTCHLITDRHSSVIGGIAVAVAMPPLILYKRLPESSSWPPSHNTLSQQLLPSSLSHFFSSLLAGLVVFDSTPQSLSDHLEDIQHTTLSCLSDQLSWQLPAFALMPLTHTSQWRSLCLSANRTAVLSTKLNGRARQTWVTLSTH